MASSTTLWKSLSIVIILILGFLASALPLFLREHFNHARGFALFMCLANAFAGGVFISIALLHLLPEGSDALQEAYGEDVDKYHAGQSLCIAGYVTILFVERVMFKTHACAQDLSGAPPDPCDHSHAKHSHANHNHSHSHSHTEHSHSDHNDSEAGKEVAVDVEMKENAGDGGSEGNEPVNEEDPKQVAAPVEKVATPIVLTCALAVHSISAGLALGAESTTHAVLLLFFTIIAHKWSAGLALGISFSRSTLELRRALVYLLVFACSTPLGIAIGWAAASLLPDSVKGYLLCYSSGTFLYIGASEILVEEYSHGGWRRSKFCFVLLGIFAIFAASSWADFD
eukprot:TRINITY_DN1075_c0_g1_i1.p1 TRINITY_DN1075_c0_g1~~TRINITY_DN1075_c0_g1_i1.p1  ORF type:complete len:341 (+),score=108.71 TRINITY_DN1075_c0_g1_i1:52-1074(+)